MHSRIYKAIRYLVPCLLLFATGAVAEAQTLNLRPQEISNRLGVGYAVNLIDMNDDKRLDIVVVDTNRVIWFENPGASSTAWEMHTLIEDQTKKDNVCFAPYDIDGDGKLDFALGADWRPIDTRTGGTIQWISRGKSPADHWLVHPIGEAPTTHRMRWADLDGDGRSELIVVPMMGRDSTKPHYMETALQVLAYKIPKDPVKGPWVPEVINEEMHVAHNFFPTDLNGDGRTDILVASFEGVSLLERSPAGKWSRTLIGTGNQETSPERGSSEIKHGKLKDGRDYIATIEPWHGFQVVVYTRPVAAVGDAKGTAAPSPLWKRTMVDDDLKWGHAVWCADLDGDGDQELIIGIRDDKNAEVKSGLRIYEPQPAADGSIAWKRQVVDPGGVAIEDLAAGDLNGDGRPDIVAVGRKTKNVRIYWNEK